MALVGLGTFNSNKIHFVLVTWLIEYRKEKRQSSKVYILDFKLECAKTNLIKFC